MEWTVRPFSEPDFPAVWVLERERDPAGFVSAVTVRQAAELWPGTFLVADGDPGIAGFTIGASSSDPSVGWVLRLKVREDCRRRGCATTLLHYLARSLRARGVRELRLTVAPWNAGGRALYLRCGFTEETLLPDHFGSGEDRLALSRRL